MKKDYEFKKGEEIFGILGDPEPFKLRILRPFFEELKKDHSLSASGEALAFSIIILKDFTITISLKQ